MLTKIGRVEIWRILEINAPFLTPEQLFPDAEDTEEVFAAYGQGQLEPETRRLILPVQGFLLKTPHHLILVDACVGNDKTNPRMPDWHQRSDGRFMAALTAAGAAPEDVDYVLCTHLHTDHVGWNTRLEDGRWIPTFPNARYLMPSEDDVFYKDTDANHYRESVAPVIAAGQAEMVTAGHELGDHVELVPTPGHTPGHVSVLIRDGGAEALITGDAIHCTVQCRRPEWEFVFYADGKAAAASRRKLLESAADAGSIVLGTHFALPSIGHVAEDGDAFRWEPL